MPVTIYDSDGDDMHFTEESSGVITLTYTDEDGNAVTPATGTWTLTDKDGTVINSRSDVAISSLSTTNDVLLSGDDLAFQTSESGREVVERLFVFEGTYNSLLGNGIPLKEQGRFFIDNIQVVV